MTQTPELEFVLVSGDYALMTAVSKGVKKMGAKFMLVPTAHDARECLNRRKIDGVFVDMDVPGALGLIESTRKGSSNNKAVIFACGGRARESTQILAVGANFLLRKPVTEENVQMHITISKDLLERERRRYFRHAVNLNVTLHDGITEQQARMTNLSGGGMAVRTAKPLKQGTALDLAFEPSLGVRVTGKGQVAWVNADGQAGIVLQTLRGKGKELLETWLAAREQLATKEPPAEG
ncbi:MAG TPA: PilZ domain-containing protein [Candidatus Acidoferrum sp.]|nr:PilZ domain-containing protein [Candidatus Acidoferrum sp.]